METTEVKKRRSVIKRQKKEADKLARQSGPSVAKLKNVPTSPRKMRLVADLIRGQKVNLALSILKFQAKAGAAKIEKLLLAAISDWQAKNSDTRLEDADLIVTDIFVDGGRILKRLRPAPQGRAHRIRKRSNHVTITVGSASDLTPTSKVEKVDAKSEIEVDAKESTKTAKSTKKSSEPKKTSKKTDKK